MAALDIHPGWVALMAGLYYVNPGGCFWPLLAAMACHELGHLLALRACGVPVRQLRLEAGGAVLETGSMDYRRELLCALAGPAANLLLLPLGRRFPTFGALCLVLALFNLLPLPPLDGGRALAAAVLPHLRPAAARRLLAGTAVASGAAAALGALYLTARLHAGFWPVAAAGLALARTAAGLFSRRGCQTRRKPL